ncbi:MAG: phosphoglycerate mutase, partial [Clostridia bacterium]|nr:phosphoglycerate mutase [Clostridia bacterium]
PLVYSKGRSPLEAMSMGLTMDDDDTAIRCNVVTLSEDEDKYEDRIMLDHSADEITTAEADQLIKALNEALGDSEKRLFTGVSYRHCLLWKNADSKYPFDRPHDIIGRRIGDYLPKCENGGEAFLEFQKKGYEILRDHPVNLDRKARGLRPANSPWLWSPGTKPALPSFSEKWGKRGAIISAVDLIKGIGICAGMEVIEVEGATGNCHTNYTGKADACIKCFEDGCDFVYVHVEGPDECGHRGEIENKVMSVEKIDSLILKPVYEYLKGCGEDFKILVLPDHPTPIEIRTHSSEHVPFFMYDSTKELCGPDTYNEDTARSMPTVINDGSTLLDLMIKG